MERYDRHLKLVGFTRNMQSDLSKKRVALVGVGGVGSSVATHLVSSGVGSIKIIDHDIIELSNLSRQFLYLEEDVYKNKVDVAKERLSKMNPSTRISCIPEKIDENNIGKYITDVDVIVEGVDNFKTRKLINSYCVKQSYPYVHASAQGSQGQVLSILPHKSACLECVFPNLPDTHRISFPILAMAANLAGNWAASEVIKILTGYGRPLHNKMMIFDLKNCVSKIVAVPQNINCNICGTGKESLTIIK